MSGEFKALSAIVLPTNPRLPGGVRNSSTFSLMAADSRASPKPSSALRTRSQSRAAAVSDAIGRGSGTNA